MSTNYFCDICLASDRCTNHSETSVQGSKRILLVFFPAMAAAPFLWHQRRGIVGRSRTPMSRNAESCRRYRERLRLDPEKWRLAKLKDRLRKSRCRAKGLSGYSQAQTSFKWLRDWRRVRGWGEKGAYEEEGNLEGLLQEEWCSCAPFCGNKCWIEKKPCIILDSITCLNTYTKLAKREQRRFTFYFLTPFMQD